MFESVLLHIDDASKVSEARRRATAMARPAGFSEERLAAAALIVSEAATNLLKHARQGQIQLCVGNGNGAGRLEVLAIDSGPGMADPERCLGDGFSTAGTAGTGLGAMRRLASEFDIFSQPEKGTVVLARVVAGVEKATALRYGVVQAPARGEEVCGDAWFIKPDGDRTVFMVADGLGHGPAAAEASALAARVCGESIDLQPAPLLERIHVALRSTRGAAVAIAHIDTAAGEVRYAGIGNIMGSLISGGTVQHMVSHNGTAGHQARKFQEFRYPWPVRPLLIMSSDGLSTHWSLDKYPGLQMRDPAIIAGVLYRDFTRGRDDATVIVAKANQ